MKPIQKKTKVLFVYHCLNYGGVEKNIVYLLNSLYKNKFDRSLFLLEKKGQLADRLEKGIKVFVPGIKNKLAFLRQVISLLTVFKQVHPDKVVVFVDRMTVLTFLSSVFSREKFELIAVIPNLSDTWYEFKTLGKIRKKILLAVMKFVHLTIVRSESARCDALRGGVAGDRVRVIRNAIPNLQKSVINCQSSDKLKLLFLGRLTKLKNIDSVIKALAGLKQRGWSGFEFLIIGDGPVRMGLENLVEKFNLSSKIRFLGWQGNPGEFLSQADLLVLVSRTEGCPLVVLEAKHYGVPSIVSDFPGSEEIVTSGSDGFVISGDISESLVDCLERFFTDKSLLVKLKQGAIESNQGFKFDEFIKNHQKVLEK